MRRLLLVANPAASGFTASLHRDVVEILEGGFEVTPIWPNGPTEARAASARAAEDEYDVVAAMGGDGVVHEVVNGIIGTPTALGVIPAGTTNVVCRILKLPRRPRDAAEFLAGDRPSRSFRALRLIRTLGSRSEEHVVSFAAGVGFDAEVIQESERRPLSKIGFGALHYARSATRVAMSYRDRLPNLRISNGDRSADAVAALFQIHDQFTYVGRFPVTLTEGEKPAVAVIERVTGPRLATVTLRGMLGRRVDRMDGIDIWPGIDRVQITAEPRSWVEADGELLGLADAVEVVADQRMLFVIGG